MHHSTIDDAKQWVPQVHANSMRSYQYARELTGANVCTVRSSA